MEARTFDSGGDGAGPGRVVGDHTRIFLRPIGSPLPLGLLALMCAGIMLSLEQLAGPFDAQLERLEREAGVRNQL